MSEQAAAHLAPGRMAAADGVAVFRGNRVRDAAALAQWHGGRAAEPVLEPALPILDAHHHLYGQAGDAHHYRLDELVADLSGGHRVIGTVYVEAFESGWRTDGDPALRSVGEVEMAVRQAGAAAQGPATPCAVAAGIVSHVDLRCGDSVAAVLEAHVAAGQARLRGVRQAATYIGGEVGKCILGAPEHLLADRGFRRGMAHLERHDLSFDALVFPGQLEELGQLADAFPRTRFILNHVGFLLGVAEHRAQRAEAGVRWARAMARLAQRHNVYVKIGGMGMPAFGFGFELAERPASSEALASAWWPLVETCLEAFGAPRCMLESNFPIDKQSCGYTALWNAFKRCTAGLSPHERRALFYGTAATAYRLPGMKVAADASSAFGD